MAISDKSRKILWGRSGNRCAICRHELVIDSTPHDAESVVGEECHIISGKGAGPRHDPLFPEDKLDEPENLALFCRVHHKMVDDQVETYTVELLRSLKKNHEAWVSSKLSDEKEIPPVRLRRIQGNVPSHLRRIENGRELLDIVGGASAANFQHDELATTAEMEAVSSFMQEAQDWGELADGFEAGQKVEAAFRMSTLIKELEAAGFLVFGAREVQRLEGGTGAPSSWPVAHLRVVRSTNPEIKRTDAPKK